MRTQVHAARRGTPFRRSVAVTATGALLAALAACGGGGGGGEAAAAAADIDVDADPASVKGTITLMRNPAEISDETIAEFNEVFPNVEVEAIDQDAVKLQSMLAAGEPPDLWRSEAAAIGSLIGQRQLMDLTGPLEEIGITDETTFDAAELHVHDGKRYGVPFDWSPDMSLFVNNRLFEQAGIPVPDPSEPLSWEEVGELAKQLTVKQGATTSQFGFGGAWETFGPARILSTRLAEAGETLYSEDQTEMVLADNPKAVEALEFMADLAKDGVTHSPVNPSASWSGQEFSDGQVAMVSYGYWFTRVVRSGETEVGTDYTMLPAPYWEDADKRIHPTITGVGMVMSSKTKEPQAAWSFFRWFLTGERAQQRAAAGSGFPVLMSDVEHLPKDEPLDKASYEVATAEAEIAPALQFNRYYDDSVFTNSYNKNLQEYIAGNMTIDELAEAVEADVNAAIQDGVDQQG